MTSRPFLLHTLAMLALMALLSGCAAMRPGAEPPRIHLVGLQMQQVELFEQRYRLTLRIQNPNDFALNIRGLDFRVDINDERFAEGVSNRPLELPGFGEALTEVEVSSSLWSLARQFRDLGDSRLERMTYRLHGRIAVTGWGLPVPFDSSGELGLLGPGR